MEDLWRNRGAPCSKMCRTQGTILPEMTPLKSDRLPDPSVPSRRDDIHARACTRLLCLFRGSCRGAMGLLLLAAIVLGVQPELARAQATATYTVTFEGNWNTDSTPGGVAGGAHFTPLIGAVHNSNATFWAPGGTATAGVESVAELGATSTFKSEIRSKGADVKETVQASGTSATGTRTFEVTFSRTHPLLTLLSMIGPSPDWFVGVSGLSLLDASNAWRSSYTRDLFPYDAGTEDGEEFSLSNLATSPQGTITSLKGQGKFSDTRMARLTFTLNQSNNAPEFLDTNATWSFAETVGDATVRSAANIGAAVTATDDDNDTLTYSLEGTDRNKFTIISGSGQIRTGAGESYDREAKASYSVTVKADDGNGGTDTIAVTVNVTDAEERPLAPAAPSVFSGSTTSVNVMWNAPSNTGRPTITSYDLQYREGMTGDWMDGPQDVPVTNSTITSLKEDTEYQVQVRASNLDGDSTWSGPGTGRTNVQGNRAPEFPGMSTTRSFAETVGDATVQSAGNVGAAVTAADADNHTLTYSLEGTDKEKFTIVPASGQIRTRVGESYDRETKASYSMMVRADDGNGGTDTIAVTVNVTDAEEKPLAPAAPSVSAASTTSVSVTWNTPSNTGRPAITSYDLQYKKSSDTSWSNGPQDVTTTSTSIGSLDEDTEYQVQVRASNSDGDGLWSSPGTGRTNLQGNGAPVPPPLPPTEEEAEERCAVSGVTDDQSLQGFVECAAEGIAASDTFEETLRLLDEFRDDKGNWNDGSTYLVLLTKRGGVYFHANDREVEDLDWSGILSCKGGGFVLARREGCLMEYDGASSGYAHPFSASHVPLAHGEKEFVLLGGFDETPDGEPLTGVIGGSSTEAGEVDTDDELRGFVEGAGRTLMVAIVNSEIDPAQLRGILRREGPWREGDVYIYIMDETGRVMFDGADRSREQKGEYAKQYVRDLIAEAGEGIVEYREGGLLRRGYAVRVEAPLDEDEASRVYIVGSEYRVEEQPSLGDQPGGGGNGGGGCAVGESDSGGAFGLFLVALALLLTVSLKRHLAEDKVH